jgi:universal stress protein A
MKTIGTSRRSSSAKPILKRGYRKTVISAAALVPRPLKVSRILVATDFSEHSRKALSYAIGFAAQFGAKLTLVHVVEPVLYPTDWMLPLPEIDFAQTRKFLIEQLKTFSKKSPVTAQPTVRYGQPAEEIVQVARERKIDLIVIGTHGHSGVKHLLIGSVAERVVRHAPCPVLTLRPDARDFL